MAMLAKTLYQLSLCASLALSIAGGSSDVPVPVPSNNDNDALSSPPAGPLPDPPSAVCSDGDDGTCSSQEEVAGGTSSSSSSSLPPSPSTAAIPTGKLYCTRDWDINNDYSVYGSEGCFYDTPRQIISPSNNTSDSSSAPTKTAGDFFTPKLEPYEVAPVLWRDSGKIVTQYAFQVGLPDSLITALLDYCEELGMIDLFRQYTSSSPIPPKEDTHNGTFVRLNDAKDGNLWYAQRPQKKWQSNMHWISPADERTHESYLRTLAKGGFDEVLEGIGTALGLDSLVAYHLTFIAVSHSQEGFPHYDTIGTEGGVYNLIIPLMVEDNVPPELILWDDGETKEGDSEKRGGLKYEVGTGAMMGDDAIHGTYECDYRNLTGAKHGGYLKNDDGTDRRIGMRLAATVYIAEIYPDNVEHVADETLTQIFPVRNKKWLLAQEARHWHDPNSEYAGMNSTMRNDMGRKAFRVDDELDDCEDRAEEGKCETDDEGTRKKCLFSCKVYIEEGPTKIEWVDKASRQINVCTQNRTGMDNCQTYTDDTSLAGQFVTPQLEPGQMFPMIWRTGDDAKRSTPYAFQIGLPPKLTTTLLDYCDKLGITDKMRDLTGENPLRANPYEASHEFHKFADGNDWYVQRPPLKWKSNMHWVSPADEKTHEEYLKVLAKGNFDLVLDAIGNYLGLEGLVAYHLTFIGVSYSQQGFLHRDTHHTGASVYNVIIPLILDPEAEPELVMTDWDDEERRGALKYKVGTGAMMGDDAMHGTEACDYRASKGMRLAATVYIADINEGNAKKIAKQTLTQIFPLADDKWLMAQAGRHWVAPTLLPSPSTDSDGDEAEVYTGAVSLVNDQGRKQFKFRDLLSNCAERVEKGLCIDDTKITRAKCLASCKIYNYLNEEDKEEQSNALEFEFDDEEYEEVGMYIDAFFDGLSEDDEDEDSSDDEDDNEDSCFDESHECEKHAKNGLCMTEPEEMEELGCHRSCLYCLSRSSRELFSLGEDQVYERDEDGDEDSEDDEKEPPTESEIDEVLAQMEHYFVNEVLVYDDLKQYRLPCRNNDKHCAYWAAQGNCELNPGWMGKRCPAVCRSCPMVELENRCPIDEETNIFQPGDINAMFERWLKEAGQDPTELSSENLPTSYSHPMGRINVISSPYHDPSQYPNDEDDDEDEETSPVPWVISIANFLTDEECDRLIELGTLRGYKRSSVYDDTSTNADGSPKFVGNKGRTSTNTFCKEGCSDDPIVEGVIERMTKLTGIPYDNYESIQLVKYEKGQFYNQHHDLSETHYNYPYGPRILTFFLYLNDVEEGGGTKFEYLDFEAKPQRGMALVWPSMTDDLEGIDDWTWHEALSVEKGVKYGANAWIHLRDYQNNPDYC